MIVGVAAGSDADAEEVVRRIAAPLHQRPVSLSIRQHVAIAAWSSDGIATNPIFEGDFAQLGNVDGIFPFGEIPELRGDFALVARRGNALRLARGRFVGRPLFWSRVDHAVVACNWLLPLARLLGPMFELNIDHIYAVFDPTLWSSLNPLPTRRVFRVGANTVVDVDSAGRTRTTAGGVEFGPELRLGPRDLARSLADEFQQSVGRQLAGLRGAAVFSGGGIDSSNLLAAAVATSRHRGGPKVVPIAFDFGGHGDDRPHLRALSEHLQVEPIRVRPAEAAAHNVQDRVVDATAHGFAPSAMVIAGGHYARHAGAQAVFTGEGSELLHSSDEMVFADYLANDPLRALACASRFKAIGEGRCGSIRRLVARPLVERYAALLLKRNRAWFRDVAWAGPRLRSYVLQPKTAGRAPYSQRERIRRLASSGLLMSTREHLSRAEIGVGLPIRFGYFDDEYLRFIGRIPSSRIFAGARERGLLRESMEDLVPDSLRYRMDKARPDQGFTELFSAIGGLTAVSELIGVRRLGELGFVEPRAFQREFVRFATNAATVPGGWFALWRVLTAEAYLQWFCEFTGRSEISVAA
jgi:asparagine synthetase B (glutamine-hydrolysing)